MKQLEIGDKLVRYWHGTPTQLYTIDRVTKTAAFAGQTRFRREYAGDRVHESGTMKTHYIGEEHTEKFNLQKAADEIYHLINKLPKRPEEYINKDLSRAKELLTELNQLLKP